MSLLLPLPLWLHCHHQHCQNGYTMVLLDSAVLSTMYCRNNDCIWAFLRLLAPFLAEVISYLFFYALTKSTFRIYHQCLKYISYIFDCKTSTPTDSLTKWSFSSRFSPQNLMHGYLASTSYWYGSCHLPLDYCLHDIVYSSYKMIDDIMI